MIRAKFLVVDDDPDNREVVASVLRDKGFEVDEALCAQDALTLLGQVEYDVLITDVDMPGMSGLELVRLVRAKPESPYAVVMSGRAMAQLAAAAGAEEFFEKPFDLEEFLAVF
ncbi:MAG: response regulator [Candidatus Magasanikbacteria bacterium]|nr:response regulator [Candidatus Magasanikbacteria bacterium]